MDKISLSLEENSEPGNYSKISCRIEGKGGVTECRIAKESGEHQLKTCMYAEPSSIHSHCMHLRFGKFCTWVKKDNNMIYK